MLRQKAGLHYRARGYGPVGPTTSAYEAFASIFFVEDSGVEVRDLYEEMIEELVEPRNTSGRGGTG